MVPQRQHWTEPHHGPRGSTGCSHQSVPHYPRFSSSASLHCAHILLFLFLTFLHHLLVPLSGTRDLRVWGGVRVALRHAIPCLCFMALDRDHRCHGFLPMLPAELHSTDWWSSQACSLSMPHGVRQVVVQGLLSTLSGIAHHLASSSFWVCTGVVVVLGLFVQGVSGGH